MIVLAFHDSGYKVKLAPQKLISSAIGAEFSGEAESELRLLEHMGNHWCFQKNETISTDNHEAGYMAK